MSCRIDGPAGPEKTFVAHVAAGIESRQHHDIIGGGIQITIGLVGELQIGHDSNTRLQLEVCEMVNRMVNTHRLIKSQVLFDFPIGSFLVITFPFVYFISEEGAQHCFTHDIPGKITLTQMLGSFQQIAR